MASNSALVLSFLDILAFSAYSWCVRRETSLACIFEHRLCGRTAFAVSVAHVAQASHSSAAERLAHTSAMVGSLFECWLGGGSSVVVVVAVVVVFVVVVVGVVVVAVAVVVC